jgi:hypothetical protein
MWLCARLFNKVDKLYHPWYSILLDAYPVTTSFSHMARTSKMHLCFHVIWEYHWSAKCRIATMKVRDWHDKDEQWIEESIGMTVFAWDFWWKNLHGNRIFCEHYGFLPPIINTLMLHIILHFVDRASCNDSR